MADIAAIFSATNDCEYRTIGSILRGMDIINPIRIAVSKAGNRSKLARALSVTPQAILKYERAWDAGNETIVPAHRAIQMEKAIGLHRHFFRPDLWTAPDAND